MNFYDLCNLSNSKALCFCLNNIEVEIEEMPLQEWEHTPTNILPGTKKFKVKFRLPKSKSAASHGHYTDETTFVFAHDMQHAKQQVIDWLKKKFVATPEKPKVPKVNYLADIKSKHMGIKAQDIKAWSDFVELLNFVSAQNKTKVPDPKSYFGPEEYKILQDQINKDKNFIDNAKLLPTRSQRLLKKLYNDLTSQMVSTPKLDFAMKTLGKKKPVQKELWQEPKEKKEKTLPKGWRYDSVFAPKRAGERLDRGTTFQEILQESKKYGIPFSVLKAARDDLYGYIIKDEAIKRKVYQGVRKKLSNIYYNIANRVGKGKQLANYIKDIERQTGTTILRPPFSNKKLQELDQASIYGWDGIADEVYKDEGAEYFGKNDSEDDNDYGQIIFDIFKNGPPELPSANQMYREALDKLLEMRDVELDQETAKKKQAAPF